MRDKMRDRIRSFLILSLMGVGLVSTLAVPVYAGPKEEQMATQVAVSQLPWNDQKSFQDCGQVCALEKGSQNLSMQALYLLQRISDLRDIYRVGGYPQVSSELASYCPNVSGTNAQDNARVCLEQYISIQTYSIRAIRTELIKNKLAVESYKSNASTAAKNDDSAKKQRQALYVSNSKEIDDQYKAENSNQLKFLAGEHYQDWVKKLPRPPTEADFTTLDSKGQIVVDKAGFQRADGKYKADQQHFQAAFQKQPVVPNPSPSSSMAADSYRTARNSYVNYSNSINVARGTAQVSFGDKNAPPAARTPSSQVVTPAGQEAVVMPAPNAQVQYVPALSADVLTHALDSIEHMRVDTTDPDYRSEYDRLTP